jgi:peroxiredoxin
MNTQKSIPSNITFKYRVRTDGNPITFVDTTNNGANPFEWKDVTTEDIFNNKRVVVFSLPGAYTPTCSTSHLPRYEELYNEIRELGVDEVYVISVNDTFVMRRWMIDQGAKNVKFIPDGNGEFTNAIGMLVCKNNLGFGNRSWRYSMVVDNGVVEKEFVEPGKEDNCPTDPFTVSDADTMVQYLKQVANS